MDTTARYAHYEALALKRHDHGILEVIMGAGQSANGKLSTADHRMHKELSTIWGDLLFLSVDTPQSTPGCTGSRNVTAGTPGEVDAFLVALAEVAPEHRLGDGHDGGVGEGVGGQRGYR